jgi:hypothetical protein
MAVYRKRPTTVMDDRAMIDEYVAYTISFSSSNKQEHACHLSP